MEREPGSDWVERGKTQEGRDMGRLRGGRAGSLWVVVLGLLLAACESAAPPSPVPLPPTATPAPPERPAAPPTGTKVTKIGFVTDSGRIDDGGYNQSIWEGVQ